MIERDGTLIGKLIALIRGENDKSPHPESSVADVELSAVERELGVSLPRSYRGFLRSFGCARVGMHDVFGLPRNRLWGDIVLMNELTGEALPSRYVKFSRDREGREYYFDTSRAGAGGECPVIVFGSAPGGTIVARDFLDFLRKAAWGAF